MRNFSDDKLLSSITKITDTFSNIAQSMKGTDKINIESIVRQKVSASIEKNNKTLLEELKSMLEKEY